jgi:low affinity Fe/Cu permease
MQAKLDELLHAVTAADERFIGIEHLTDKDLAKILAEVEARAQRLHKGDDQMPVVATRAEDLSAGSRKPAAKKARALRRASA